MHFLAFSILPLFTVLTFGCSSTNNAKPLTQTITAEKKNEISHIYWLDEDKNKPVNLSQLTLKGNVITHKSEYRWVDGVIREILSDGKQRIDGQLKHQLLKIRYDSQGIAVFQNYRLDGDLLPIKNDDLIAYYQQAQNVLAKTRELQKNQQDFFQGYLEKNTDSSLLLKTCQNNEEMLTFNAKLPSPLMQHMLNKKHFIAAIGNTQKAPYQLENIILLEDSDANCIFRPKFEL